MNPAIHGNVQGVHKILDFNNVRNSMETISRSVGYHLMLNGYQSTPQVSTRSYFEFNVKVLAKYQIFNITLFFFTLKFEVQTVANSFVAFKTHPLIIFLVPLLLMGPNVVPTPLMLVSKVSV